MNPKFAAAARAAKTLLDELLPPFAGLGACAGKAPNRAALEEMFCDDIAYQRDPTKYLWPAGVMTAMSMCATCPVRVQCLAWAFAVEKRESQDWWTGELEQTDRRYGVLGGVPGRIREHYADDQDPVSACDTWFQDQANTRHLAIRANISEREETA